MLKYVKDPKTDHLKWVFSCCWWISGVMRFTTPNLTWTKWTRELLGIDRCRLVLWNLLDWNMVYHVLFSLSKPNLTFETHRMHMKSGILKIEHFIRLKVSSRYPQCVFLGRRPPQVSHAGPSDGCFRGCAVGHISRPAVSPDGFLRGMVKSWPYLPMKNGPGYVVNLVHLLPFIGNHHDRASGIIFVMVR
jgi:hypothetical protein